MPRCPRCGTNVEKPAKKWKMVGRPDKSGKKISLEIASYSCSNCRKTFRGVLGVKKGYRSPIIPPDEKPSRREDDDNKRES